MYIENILCYIYITYLHVIRNSGIRKQKFSVIIFSFLWSFKLFVNNYFFIRLSFVQILSTFWCSWANRNWKRVIQVVVSYFFRPRKLGFLDRTWISSEFILVYLSILTVMKWLLSVSANIFVLLYCYVDNFTRVL